MNSFQLLFHLATLHDPNFQTDDQSFLLALEANRLCWDSVPMPHGDRVAFATGYVMGRENMGRDQTLPLGHSVDYDIGYECGQRVLRGGQRRPDWDRINTMH